MYKESTISIISTDLNQSEFVACTHSHNAAIWARQLGYNNVYRYPGGIHAWQGAGYPTGKK